MKAFVIKNKEGKYLDDYQQQPFFATDDLTKTNFYKTYEKAKENCRNKDCEVVEITIVEGNLDTYIDKLQNERDFERRDKTYIVKQLNDPNDYVIREDYMKLEQENKQLKEQLAIREKENESLNNRINNIESIFRGRSRATKRTGDVYKDFVLEIRKRVCDEIREKLEMDEYNTCENTAFCVYLDYLKEILDQIEQAKESMK